MKAVIVADGAHAPADRHLLQGADLVEDLRRGDPVHLRRSIATETLRLYSRPNLYREVKEDFDLEGPDGRRVRFTAGEK